MVYVAEGGRVHVTSTDAFESSIFLVLFQDITVMLFTEPPPQSRLAGHPIQPDQGTNPAGCASSYGALLTFPLSRLASRTLERADVESVAVLGYN